MKTLVVSAVSIVLVSILFCPMVMAAPAMPADLQMVQPDPSLPKELSAFFGKWEGVGNSNFLIVEKIDGEKASIYLIRPGAPPDVPKGWQKYEANVSKYGGKYTLSVMDQIGRVEYTLKGDYLNADSRLGGGRYRRVQ